MNIALNQRERTLAVVIVALLGLVLLYFLFSAWQGPRRALRTQRAQATAELNQLKDRLELAARAEQQLQAWRRRSLPANAEAAVSLYQNWLLQTARNAGLRSITIDAAQGRRRPEVFQALRLNLQATANLEQLTTFLHRFYQAGHLHQIVVLVMLPESRGDQLALQLTIEALSLPAADRTEELTTAPSGHDLAALSVYHDAIARRNLFAAYQPPPPSRPAVAETPRPAPQPRPTTPPPPRFDPVRHAYLTGIVRTVDDRWQAWILARTSGETFELFEGDAFQIGDTRGKMLRIEEREAEIEFDGKRYVVPLGDNLRAAAPPRD